ncbi:MAG: PP2C family protein-serine/threonine phosphatase [Rubripirellula sp.]
MSDRWNSGIAFAELTDVGMRRANNQDSMVSLPAKTEERFWTRGHLFVVADGMGAHAAGELASQIATEQIAMHYFRNSEDKPAEALLNAVTGANAEIHHRGQSNPEFHNMGTTACSLALVPEGALVAHVGDSRVYRLRAGTFEQLTFDHSLVWEMEASGHIDTSIWGKSIPKNVITRSLGPNAEVDIDIEGPFAVEAGDAFLLCSDGLTGLVDDCEIGALIDCLPEDLATRVLVDLANLRGGSDNTTVVVVRVNSPSASGTSKAAKGKSSMDPKNQILPILIGVTLLCFATTVIAALMQNWGLMIMTTMLTLICGVATSLQLLRNRAPEPSEPVTMGGKGPYRRYDATPTADLYQRLGATVQALKDASKQNNWMMEWKKVNKYQARGMEALKANNAKGAIRCQAQAIIETMNQLREQNNRAANETAIEN